MPIGHASKDDPSRRCSRIRGSGFAVTVGGHGGSGCEHVEMAAGGGSFQLVTARHQLKHLNKIIKINKMSWITG